MRVSSEAVEIECGCGRKFKSQPSFMAHRRHKKSAACRQSPNYLVPEPGPSAAAPLGDGLDPEIKDPAERFSAGLEGFLGEPPAPEVVQAYREGRPDLGLLEDPADEPFNEGEPAASSTAPAPKAPAGPRVVESENGAGPTGIREPVTFPPTTRALYDFCKAELGFQGSFASWAELSIERFWRQAGFEVVVMIQAAQDGRYSEGARVGAAR